MRNEIWLAISTLIIAINTIPVAASSKDAYLAETDSTVVVRDYIANMEYVNGVLERVNFEGGYIDMTEDSPRYMYYETDHLGNVRAVVDEDGNVCQENHYYPYGDRFDDTRDMTVEESDNTKLFGGKEYSEDTGLHDFEARYDNTLFGRFTTIDPMAEKYYSVSPYAYCAGNPVNRVDPSGRDSWGLSVDGTISWLEESDEHRLYIMDGDTKSNIFVKVFDRTILDALCEKRNDGIVSGFSTYADDVYKLFMFIADNSTNEWIVNRYSDGYIIGSKHSPRSSGSWDEYRSIKPLASVHSHPDLSGDSITLSNKMDTMGFWDGGRLAAGDWKHARDDIKKNGVSARMSYVFFPYDKSLYYMSFQGPIYIKTLSNGYRGFYFGTLNNR